MKLYPLDKRHKLCRQKDIESLFANKSPNARIAFPIRAVWNVNEKRLPDEVKVKILVSIPKKRLRRAVDRVTMRRRIREAYRLLRPEVEPENASGLDLAFVYVADKPVEFAQVSRAMRKILNTVHNIQPSVEPIPHGANVPNSLQDSLSNLQPNGDE